MTAGRPSDATYHLNHVNIRNAYVDKRQLRPKLIQGAHAIRAAASESDTYPDCFKEQRKSFGGVAIFINN